MTDAVPSPLTGARAALAAERPADARALLLPLLDGNAEQGEACLLLAKAEAALGSSDAARSAFEHCLTLAPKEPVVWLDFAIFEAEQARGGSVAARARKAGLPAALVTMVQAAGTGQGAKALGTGAATRADLAALSKAGGLRAVEARALPLLRARPGAVVWGLLAQARHDAGRSAAAVEAFRQGLRLEPYAVDLRLGLVRALAAQGDLTTALMEARRAAQMAPLSRAAQLTYGRISLQTGLGERAMATADRLLTRHPKDDAVLALAAEAALLVNRPDDAVGFARARSAKARDRLMLLARVLRDAGDTAACVTTLDCILEATPNDATALAERGQQRQTAGDLTGAEADLRASLAADPSAGVAARALAYGVKLPAGDPAIATMRATLARPDLSAAARRTLDYALARALQPHDAATAAAHLATANASMARSYPYDPRQMTALFARATEVVWPAVRSAQDAGRVSGAKAAPIFVTGMPRSGTTLVEAILSAHPDVAAGGEMGLLKDSLSDLTARAVAGDEIAADHLTAAGEAYAAAARRLVGDAPRFVDKSIFTYFDIGTARAILPAARIVVVTRDPRDTGLSIWRNAFREGTHRYATTQEGIADQIALFERTVAFWEAALPGAVHRIAYEDLLDDPEGRSRALLAFADLPWDARVLSFHEHAGQVRTLSFAQVRQPLYRSSRGGWERSAEEIAPLIAALEKRGLLPD